MEVDGAEELWGGLIGGLVRAPAALAAHDDDTQARVRAAFDELVAGFATSAGDLRVPAVVRVGAGRVPPSR